MNNSSLSFYIRYQRESQSSTGIFGVEEHNGTDVNTVQCRRELQIKDGRLEQEVEMKRRNYSASILNSNEIQKATPTFSGSSNSVELV